MTLCNQLGHMCRSPKLGLVTLRRQGTAILLPTLLETLWGRIGKRTESRPPPPPLSRIACCRGEDAHL